MHYFKRIFYTILLLFILIASIVLFLLTSTPGLYAVTKLANLGLPGKIQIQNPKGRLIDQFSFRRLNYEDQTIALQIDHLKLTWHFSSLLRGELNLIHMNADKISIKPKHPIEPKEPPKQAVKETPWTLPKLPIRMNLQDIYVNLIEYQQDQTVTRIHQFKTQAKFNEHSWAISQLKALYADHTIALKTELLPTYPYSFTAILQIHPKKSNAQTLTGTLSVDGNFKKYHWNGKFNGLFYGEIHGALKEGRDIESTAKWRNIQWPITQDKTLDNPNGQLRIHGTLSEAHIEAEARINQPIQANWVLNAQIKPDQIQAKNVLHLTHGLIQSEITYDLTPKPALHGSIKADSIDLTEFNLPVKGLFFKSQFSGLSPESYTAHATLSADYFDQRLRAEVDLNQQQMQGQLSLAANQLTFEGKLPFQWQATLFAPKPELLHPSLAGLQTKVQANLALNGPSNGSLHLAISPGSYHAPETSDIPPIRLNGGYLNATLTPKQLDAKGHFNLDQQKTLSVSLAMPGFSLAKQDLGKQKLNGQLKLNINSFSFLDGLVQDIKAPKGQLIAEINTDGTIDHPNLTGQISLNDASVTVPALNLTLNPIHFKLETQKKQWQATGQLVSNGKRLDLSGQGQFDPMFNGKIKINSDDFPAINTDEYLIHIAPNLTIEATSKSIQVNGTVLIPSATIKPLSFAQSETLTSDAVMLDQDQKERTTPLMIGANVEIIMGNQVQLDIQGLTGTLEGNVQYTQHPGGSPLAVGELRVRDGKYQAYGQKLIIEEGQLLFSGGLITNPGIRVRAVRTFQTSTFSGSGGYFDFNANNLQSIDFGRQTKVGIEVSGRVNSPKIKLFSVPSSLSQADILSMLILGRPASQADRAGGQLLMTALSSMNLDTGTKGTQLLSQLKQSLGFDVDLQGSSTYNQQTNQVSDSTALTLGKSLSKRLRFSYSMGLFHDDSNVFTLRYLLNQFFSIQVTASDTGSGIDFLYTHQKE